MKRPALHNKQVGVLRMVFRARKVFGTFEKRAPGIIKTKTFRGTELCSHFDLYSLYNNRVASLTNTFTFIPKRRREKPTWQKKVRTYHWNGIFCRQDPRRIPQDKSIWSCPWCCDRPGYIFRGFHTHWYLEIKLPRNDRREKKQVPWSRLLKLISALTVWGLFLESPENFSGPKSQL